MKKVFGFLMICSVILMMISCGDNEPETMDISVNYKLTYGGDPLVMFADYKYPTGESMFFSRYSMFVSNVGFVNQTGTVNVDEVQYLDFTNTNATDAGAEEGITLTYKNVEKGKLDKLLFTIGLSPDQNSKTPADFTSSSPLSRAAEYWPGWTSYIFTRTEGQIKLNGIDEGFSLHTGANEAAINFEGDLGADFEKPTQRKITIYIDLKEYFGSNPAYDISQNPQIHSLSQQPQVLELRNNMTKSIKFTYE